MELTATFGNLGELKAAIEHLSRTAPDGAGVKFTKRGEVHTLHADFDSDAAATKSG